MAHAPHTHDDDHDDFGGLDRDLPLLARQATLLDRRGALRLLGGLSLVALAGCGSKAVTAATGSSATTAASTGTGAAAATASSSTTSGAIPEETAGPYPGDGSNGPNVLTQSGVVRSDIRSSFGSASASATAAGVPLTIKLTVVDAATGAVKPGAAVYVWHCNRDGQYSLYGQGITGENYLRGVQAADSGGVVTFQSIFPAAYSGRWPHIHFEVYESLAKATAAGSKLTTSQIAMPEAACKLVYATDGYSQSVRNLAQTSLATDMVFGDGWDAELGTVTGTIAAGMTVALKVPV